VADQIPRAVPPRGIMGLRKSVLLVGGIALLVVALGLAWGVHWLTKPRHKTVSLPAAPMTHALQQRKARLEGEPHTYDAIPKPKPPPAMPPRGIPVTRVVEASTMPQNMPRPEVHGAAVQPLPVPTGPSAMEVEARIRAGIAEAKAQMLADRVREQEAQLAQLRAMAANPVAQGQGTPGGTGEAGTNGGAPPKRTANRWLDHAGESKSFNIKREKATKEGKAPEQDSPQTLIPRAVWAKPAQVDKVLYWDQPIIAEVQTAINSDIPGEVRFKVLRAVLDREMRGREIIPALTSMKGQQDGIAKFGQQRVNVAVSEMIFPDGTVVHLPQSRIADPSGAAGIPAEVDNHYGRLLMGLLFSVGFNVGTRVAAGQPSGEQYTIQQELAREAGQGANREAQRIVEQFRVPPTLKAKAGDEVSLYASQNINFSQLPITVR
jgi:type IV secretory pathway VirB10-like protein